MDVDYLSPVAARATRTGSVSSFNGTVYTTIPYPYSTPEYSPMPPPTPTLVQPSASSTTSSATSSTTSSTPLPSYVPTTPPTPLPFLTTASPTEDHHREMEDLLNNEVVQRVLKDPELGDLLKHADNPSSRASPGLSLSTIQTTLLNSSVLRALLTDGPLIQRIANVQTVLPVSESTDSSRVT
jgi:hypothetical protein